MSNILHNSINKTEFFYNSDIPIETRLTFDYGFLHNAKCIKINNNITEFAISRMGDLFMGICIDEKKLNDINSITLCIGGSEICTLDKYTIRGATKNIKVRDNINNTVENEKIILFFNNTCIPLVALPYHEVRIIINSNKPIKYLYIVYRYLEQNIRSSLVSKNLELYYCLSNKNTFIVRYMYGMGGLMNFNIVLPEEILKHVVNIQKRYKAKFRLKKLKFHKELLEAVDKIIYKPDYLGYQNLLEKYKGVFIT